MSQPTPRSTLLGEHLAVLGIAAVVIATVLLGALAPHHAASPVRSAADDPHCLEWSNGCQICKRWPDNVACSLPGIACEPGPQRCLIRSDG